MPFFSNNDVAVGAGVPSIGSAVLNAEFSAGGNVGFAVPDKIIAVAGHVLACPVIEGSPKLHIILDLLGSIRLMEILIGEGA